MIFEILAALIVAAFLIGTAARANQWAVRRRGLSRMAGEPIRRIERGIDLRVLVSGNRRYAGLNPKKRNRTRGDLAISDTRVVLTSARGVILDATLTSSGITSARTTGPGRLVIEGALPRTSSGPGAQYRIETVVEDAEGWTEALRPWVTSEPTTSC